MRDPAVQGGRLATGQASAGARWNPALLVLAVAMAAVLAGLPFLKAAPNRLVSGEPVFFATLLQGPDSTLAWVMLALLAGLLALSLTPQRKPGLWVVACMGALLLPCLVALAATHASLLAQTGSPLARTSLGGGFWLALLLAGLMAGDALQRLQAGRGVRLLVLAAVVLPIALMLASGFCAQLSIMKEYANRADDFGAIVLRHLQIVGIALAFTLVIGLPLGWAANRYGRVGRTLLPVLNVVQTIPSIALFGLLMAPLAWLATRWPGLGQAGISGVGLAPGVLALVLYSLLPVVRGMLAGLQQVPSGALQAARGLGMTAPRIFWQVEAPLALPVVLGGVRTATIQAVGLAAVTALIGAGGLGAIMFEGLFANAQDLVLLGVLPIVAMGVLADLAFRGLIRLSRFSIPPGQGTA